MFNTKVNKPLIVFATVATVGTLIVLINLNKNGNPALPTPTPTHSEKKSTSFYTFDEIDLAFSAPDTFNVNIDQINNKLFILNIKDTQSTYTMVGTFEYLDEPSTINTESFKENLKAESIRELTVSGFPAIEGILKQKESLLIYIITGKGLFTLSTNPINDESKALTRQILESYTIK